MKENENTEPVYYPVSEAVQKSGVPSHVLRYWEDELRLTIRRSPQGHRIYSEADIVMFQKVKELKDKGIQLKAIRLLLEHSENPEDSLQLGQLLDEMSGTAAETAMGAVMQPGDPDEGDGRSPETEDKPAED
ncbi:MAG: helix-turn-helix domain-containing protein, partial [Clostridiales bacterium]|nr:helix-turn-helix domain-containing protein [Clostridiales bacterium]